MKFEGSKGFLVDSPASWAEQITFVAERLSKRLERWELHPIMKPLARDFGLFFYAYVDARFERANVVHIYSKRMGEWWYRSAERIAGTDSYYVSRFDWEEAVRFYKDDITMQTAVGWDRFQHEFSSHVEKVMLSD